MAYFFISLFKRAFKMMKNSIYFIVLALLVAASFKILIYENSMTCNVTMWTQSGEKSQKIESLSRFFLYGTAVTLFTKFLDMSTVTFPWQYNGLQTLSIQRGKSEFSSFKKCYLLLMFIQRV